MKESEIPAKGGLPIYVFFSVVYYLLLQLEWRDKIRNSTPLHILSLSDILIFFCSSNWRLQCSCKQHRLCCVHRNPAQNVQSSHCITMLEAVNQGKDRSPPSPHASTCSEYWPVLFWRESCLFYQQLQQAKSHMKYNRSTKDHVTNPSTSAPSLFFDS